MPKSKRHKILSIPGFAKRYGFSVEAVLKWMYKKVLTAPILVVGRDGLPRIDETEWRKEYLAE